MLFTRQSRLRDLEAKQKEIIEALERMTRALTDLRESARREAAPDATAAAMAALSALAQSTVETAPKAYELLGQTLASMSQMMTRTAASSFGRVGGRARSAKRKVEAARQESDQYVADETRRMVESCGDCLAQSRGVEWASRPVTSDTLRHRDEGHEEMLRSLMFAAQQMQLPLEQLKQ